MNAWRFVAACILLGAFLATPAQALIEGGYGNEPHRDPGWPAGAVEVANLESRLAWWVGPPFGGGEYHFLYRSETEQFQEALDLFAQINAPELQLVIHDGVHESFWLKLGEETNDNPRVDWMLTVWIPVQWHQLFNQPGIYFLADRPQFRATVAPPRLDVYVGGSIDWTAITVPENIDVIDERAVSAGYSEEDGAVVRGTVYDMLYGKPIAGATVTVNQRGDQAFSGSTTTDEAGRFELTGIPAGYAMVQVNADGYVNRYAGDVDMTEHGLKTLIVHLVPPTSVTGQVVDAEGEPIEGVHVAAAQSIAPDGRGYAPAGVIEAETDADGRFRVEGIPQGFARLRCRAQGLYQLDPFRLVDLSDTERPLQYTMVQTSDIEVTVVDEEGNPVGRGHMVQMGEETSGRGTWGGSANLGPDGTYTFQGVPPRRYWLTARPNPGSADDESEPVWIDVEPGRNQQVRIILP